MPALQVVHFLMGGESLVQSVALTEHVGWAVHACGRVAWSACMRAWRPWVVNMVVGFAPGGA